MAALGNYYATARSTATSIAIDYHQQIYNNQFKDYLNLLNQPSSNPNPVKSSRFIDQLRDEIKSWHGSLAA